MVKGVLGSLRLCGFRWYGLVFFSSFGGWAWFQIFIS